MVSGAQRRRRVAESNQHHSPLRSTQIQTAGRAIARATLNAGARRKCWPGLRPARRFIFVPPEAMLRGERVDATVSSKRSRCPL